MSKNILYFKKYFGFLKMDKNKCPKFKTKFTFWERIVNNIYYSILNLKKKLKKIFNVFKTL